MKIRLIAALIAGLTAISFADIKAQTTSATVSPSALKAAEEMLIASGGSVQFEKSLSATVEQLATSIPADKRPKFIASIKGFMIKYCGWEVMKGELSALYAHEFTEADLKQLTAFYKSPLGMKLNEKLPLITQTSMALGQKAAAAHQEELQQLMMAAMQN